jgi:hypothetical protein
MALSDPLRPVRPPETDLSTTYALVIVTEVVVILLLYWFSQHFSS